MKLLETEGEVERFGIESESSFRIKATGKAFRALSDTLYSDKPLAIVRELGANAFDSHAAAGNLDKPFLIHAPNALEPYFSIRDYGVGLTREEVQEVYTTYFESTKTGSNDYVGCLGLGSKTPFSYNDQFTVVSYKDGVKYQYSAYMNEEDVPTIALLDESETDEPNGLEVSVAIKREDYNTFVKKINHVFTYYKVKPTVVGAKVTFEDIKYKFSGQGWGLVESVNPYGSTRGTGVYAVMGNIAYPIHASFANNLNRLQLALLNLNLDIFFDIGELEITLSREKLSFKPKVIDTILERLDVIGNEILKNIEDDIKGSESLWEASIVARERYINTDFRAVYQELLKKNSVTWNGKALLDASINVDSKEWEITSFYIGRKRGYYGSYMPKHKGLETFVNVASNTRFFVSDVARGSHSRLNAQLEKEIAAGKSEIWFYLIDFKTATARQKFVELTGILDKDIELISNIEKPVREKTERAKTVQAFKYYYRSSYNSTSNWTEEAVNVAAGGIYVPLERLTVVINGKEKTNDYIQNILLLLEGIGHSMTGKTVYGVRSTLYKKIKDDPNWVTIDDYAKKVLETELAKLQSKDDIDIYSLNYSSLYDNLTKDFTQHVVNKGLNQDSEFVQIHNQMKHIYNVLQNKNILALGKLANFFGYVNSSKPISINDLLVKLTTKYPMLKLAQDIGLSYTTKRGYLQKIVDYIRLVDSQDGKNYSAQQLTTP